MLLCIIRSPTAYQLLDQAGRPVGTVVQPASDRVVGRAAGTVLLTRTGTPPSPTPLFRRVSSATRVGASSRPTGSVM